MQEFVTYAHGATDCSRQPPTILVIEHPNIYKNSTTTVRQRFFAFRALWQFYLNKNSDGIVRGCPEFICWNRERIQVYRREKAQWTPENSLYQTALPHSEYTRNKTLATTKQLKNTGNISACRHHIPSQILYLNVLKIFVIQVTCLSQSIPGFISIKKKNYKTKI